MRACIGRGVAWIGWAQLPWLRWRKGRGTEAGLRSRAKTLLDVTLRSQEEPKDYHDLVGAR